MRAVFFGTPELTVPCLAAVAEAHEVVALVCQPDRPKGRGKKLEPPPAKVWAQANGIPVAQPEKLNDGAFEAWLRQQAPDICLIAAYGRILKQPILDIPPYGYLNMHPSLLPKYRGPSPIRTALLNGDEVTGVTIMRLTLEMDAGDILFQEEEPVLPEDNWVSLSNRLAVKGAGLLVAGVNAIAAGTACFRPQDHSKAVYCRMFEKSDGQLRWGRPAREIHNLVRAAVSWPVAHCLYKGEICRIHASQVVQGTHDARPGTVVAVEKDRVLVAAGEELLAILAFQAPGKRAMSMEEYLRGHSIQVGERFEDL
ncbi:MAG TPA: methionyl-tRNA formyltransferase [Candidatus Hydrogenedentes bacterium]|nr:methionyl-tRNA formyltransferase [Candidatus Hydrogenedentota bacterium]